MKSLINIKSNDRICFLWCHIRHLNPLKTYSESITKVDKNMGNNLDYEGNRFPVSTRNYCNIEKKINTCITVFGYKNDLNYPVYVSDQKFKNCKDLLLISNENKSHHVYIKNFNIFMCNETKYKNKRHFCRYCLQCFSSEKILIKHKGTCFKINGKQSIKLKSGSNKFKNHFEQLAVPFKIYADFEFLSKEV